MSSRPELRLDWCSHEAAKYAVEHWHYSGVLPCPPQVFVGVWEAGQFVGCVVFSRGAAQHIGRPFGVEQTEVCELTRVALRSAHAAPVSRVVAVALRLLRQKEPGLRLVVSYADPGHQHHGGIYQAGNWLYLGKKSDTVEFLAPDGKQWHGRMVSATGRKLVYGQSRPVWRRDQCEPVTCEGKHKYAMPLDDAMRQQLLSLAKPYPKREKQGSGVPTPSGGAAPTLTLQEATG